MACLIAYMQQTREQYSTPSERSREAGALNVGNRIRLLAIARTQNVAEGAGRGQHAFNLQPVHDVEQCIGVIFFLCSARRGLIAGGQNNGFRLEVQHFSLLREINCICRTGLFAFATEEAMIDINQRLLRHCRRERDIDGAVPTHVQIEGVGQVDRAVILALATAGAGAFIDITRLLHYIQIESLCAARQRVALRSM